MAPHRAVPRRDGDGLREVPSRPVDDVHAREDEGGVAGLSVVVWWGDELALGRDLREAHQHVLASWGGCEGLGGEWSVASETKGTANGSHARDPMDGARSA